MEDKITKTFFEDALPANQNGHLLAIGELHAASEHLLFLRENLKALKDNHNVRTIGVELSPMMNILFWAYRDGKLPVPKGKERAFITTMMQFYGRGDIKNQMALKAELIMNAIDMGIDVVAFDGRKLFNEYIRAASISIKEMGKFPELTQILHGEIDLSRIKGVLGNVESQMKASFPQLQQVSSDLMTSDLKFSLLVREIEALCTQYPEYGERLVGVEKLSATLRQKGQPRDAISASLLENATQNTSGNILTIFGSGHMGGHSTPLAQTDGKLTEFMRDKGWTVTPAIMLGREEFQTVMSPHEASQKWAPSPAVSSQPMNLIALGTNGKDTIILKDLHKGVLPEDAAASDIGQYVDSHLNLFASTPEHIARDKQSILRSAKSYLKQIITPKFFPSDSANPKELDIRQSIDDLVENSASTHTETLQMIHSALRYIESSSKLKPIEKRPYIETLKQFVGYLENYCMPDSIMWRQAVVRSGPNGYGHDMLGT